MHTKSDDPHSQIEGTHLVLRLSIEQAKVLTAQSEQLIVRYRQATAERSDGEVSGQDNAPEDRELSA